MISEAHYYAGSAMVFFLPIASFIAVLIHEAMK